MLNESKVIENNFTEEDQDMLEIALLNDECLNIELDELVNELDQRRIWS